MDQEAELGGASDIEPWLDRRDWIILLSLTLLAAFVYLPFLYYLPYQINTDEFAIRDCILELPKTMGWQDLLGPSAYNGFPTLVHVVFGNLAKMLGGVTFTRLREVHALFGLACMPLSYIFFRTLRLGKGMAAAASLIAIFNHALVAISRMVSRNNTSLFIELGALTILFRAFETRNKALMFLGGLVAGLSFYTYTPARTTFPTFLLAGFLIYLFNRKERLSELGKLLAPAIVSYAIVISPMVWVTTHSAPEKNQYQDGQFLFTDAGLKNEQHQVGADSLESGYLTNVVQGLLAYNLPIPDNGYIYINEHVGFLEGLTGITLWLGIFSVFALRQERKKLWDADVLCVSGFVGLMLIYAFLVTFAPDYTRLFTTLPFIAYLSVNGIALLARVLSRIGEASLPTRIASERTIFWSATSFVFFSNFAILSLYAVDGLRQGQVHGGTYRLKEARAREPKWHSVLVVDEQFPYYSRGTAIDWATWVDGTRENSHTIVASPADIDQALSGRDDLLRRPVTLFMKRGLWEREIAKFNNYDPHYSVTEITSKDSRVAIDLP